MTDKTQPNLPQPSESHSSVLSLAIWARNFAPGTISGSVYAVPAASRLQAARLLTERGHRVHVDLIITDDGTHTGVTPDELLLMHRAVPEARFDVHLILPTIEMIASVRSAAETAIWAAGEVRAEFFALAPRVLRDFADALENLRTKEVPIWAEVSIGDDLTGLRRADGALVMLIESGTKNAADPSQLRKVARLAGTTPVGIDGGVTATVADDALQLGADVIVSGRSLFEIAG
jgi:pentose-5-phosphate-3-epimerase